MEPLRIDFELKTSMRFPDYAIHLDSLIAWAVVDEHMHSDQVADVDFDAIIKELPIQMHTHQDGPVWMASKLLFTPGPLESIPIIRRFNIIETILDNGVVYPLQSREKWDNEGSSTPYKAYKFEDYLQHTRHASAWVIGDRDRLQALLTRVTHIGKYKRLDRGRVQSFNIVQDDSALQKWKWRTLPWQEPNYAMTCETVRPPYWKRERRQVAYIPLATQP